MSRPPNIVFIMPDQLRADFVGCYGADFVRTPNIDSLAAHGDMFERAVAPFPICVPCRAAMLTGLNAVETGVIDNDKWLRPDRAAMGVRTWPELLSDAGYHTASIGKMHFYPWDLQEGFAERITSEDKRHIGVRDDYADDLARHGLRKLHGHELQGYAETKGAGLSGLPDDFQADHWVADRAVEFIERQPADKPYAAFIGFPSPHCPYDPTAEALRAVDAGAIPPPIPPTEESERLRHWMVGNYRAPWADLDYESLTSAQIAAIRHHYVALIEMLDAEIGRVLAALRASDSSRDTVVIFASDHGDFVGDYRMVGKTLFYEPSIRVPLILADLRAPARPRRRTSLVALPDLFETLLDVAGVASPWAGGQYRSLRAEDDPERTVFGACPHGFMALRRDFKLCRYRNGVETAFDLAADPTEQHNLFGEPARAGDIRALDRFLTDVLMRSLANANADKDVRGAKAADPDAFNRRGWQRPYPAPSAAVDITERR